LEPRTILELLAWESHESLPRPLDRAAIADGAATPELVGSAALLHIPRQLDEAPVVLRRYRVREAAISMEDSKNDSYIEHEYSTSVQ
jgi:hypothetical protein